MPPQALDASFLAAVRPYGLSTKLSLTLPVWQAAARSPSCSLMRRDFALARRPAMKHRPPNLAIANIADPSPPAEGLRERLQRSMGRCDSAEVGGPGHRQIEQEIAPRLESCEFFRWDRRADQM